MHGDGEWIILLSHVAPQHVCTHWHHHYPGTPVMNRMMASRLTCPWILLSWIGSALTILKAIFMCCLYRNISREIKKCSISAFSEIPVTAAVKLPIKVLHFYNSQVCSLTTFAKANVKTYCLDLKIKDVSVFSWTCCLTARVAVKKHLLRLLLQHKFVFHFPYQTDNSLVRNFCEPFQIC